MNENVLTLTLALAVEVDIIQCTSTDDDGVASSGSMYLLDQVLRSGIEALKTQAARRPTQFINKVESFWRELSVVNILWCSG